MTVSRRLGLLLIALGLAGCVGGGRTPEPTVDAPDWAELGLARLPALERCELPGVEEDALCARVEVREDRALEGGRTIRLNVLVVPATATDPPDDAIFVFEGGPGGAATTRAVGSIFAGPVRARDIVLVDQRGTGDSNKLECELGGPAAELGRLAPMFPPEAVAECAASLAEHADLLRYTSVDHADDIEEVRRTLGYGSINLRGGSYGTRAMMVYAQRYPESTRTMFGIGVDSPLRSNLAERGALAERALEGVAELCRGQAECLALTPDLDGSIERLLEGLNERPRREVISDPLEVTVDLTVTADRDWLAEKLRLIAYFAFTARALPWAVHRAESADDWQPLLQLAVTLERSFRGSLATGVTLSVQCSENMDFDVEAALARGADTLFGNYRLEQQLVGCSVWPHRRVPPLGLETPRVLGVPTLLLSGRLDAVTPPAYAEDARELFPNSAHVVLEEGQHGPFDLENAWTCVHEMWAAFLAAGSVKDLDTSCTEGLIRPPFLSSADEFDNYLQGTLSQL